MLYKGIIKINGRQYNAEVINGERFVNGMIIDDFLSTLHWQDLYDLVRTGGIVIEDIVNEEEIMRSPQKIMNEFYQEKNN